MYALRQGRRHLHLGGCSRATRQRSHAARPQLPSSRADRRRPRIRACSPSRHTGRGRQCPGQLRLNSIPHAVQHQHGQQLIDVAHYSNCSVIAKVVISIFAVSYTYYRHLKPAKDLPCLLRRRHQLQTLVIATGIYTLCDHSPGGVLLAEDLNNIMCAVPRFTLSVISSHPLFYIQGFYMFMSCYSL